MFFAVQACFDTFAMLRKEDWACFDTLAMLRKEDCQSCFDKLAMLRKEDCQSCIPPSLHAESTRPTPTTQAQHNVARGHPSMPIFSSNVEPAAATHATQEFCAMAQIMMEDSVWLDDHQSRANCSPSCAYVEHFDLDSCHATNQKPSTRRASEDLRLSTQLHSMSYITSDSHSDLHGERLHVIAEFVDLEGRPAAAKSTAALLSRVACVQDGNGTAVASHGPRITMLPHTPSCRRQPTSCRTGID
jgi:hypothetical protein